jgi:hypothetical protein
VVAGYLDHCALSIGGRDPERVAGSLHDESRNRNRVQFRKTARARSRLRTLRRLQRKGQTHHRDRIRKAGSTARNPRPQRTTSNQQRQAAQLPLPQAGNHHQPRCVKLARRSRRTSPGDPVGLLHQADTYTLRQRDLAHRRQVGRLHPSPGTMAKHQSGSRPVRSMQINPRPPRRRLHFEHSHPRDADTSIVAMSRPSDLGVISTLGLEVPVGVVARQRLPRRLRRGVHGRGAPQRCQVQLQARRNRGTPARE